MKLLRADLHQASQLYQAWREISPGFSSGVTPR